MRKGDKNNEEALIYIVPKNPNTPVKLIFEDDISIEERVKEELLASIWGEGWRDIKFGVYEMSNEEAENYNEESD